MKLKQVIYDDWKTLLSWRNETSTRQNSLDQTVILAETHKQWLKQSLMNPDRHLFLATVDNEPVGTIRIDRDENDCWEVSFTIGPNNRGRGYGKKMLRQLDTQLEGNLTAKVKSDNIASQKMMEFIGMKMVANNDGILYYQKLRKPVAPVIPISSETVLSKTA